jgi:hypothetical protein
MGSYSCAHLRDIYLFSNTILYIFIVRRWIKNLFIYLSLGPGSMQVLNKIYKIKKKLRTFFHHEITVK